MATQRGYFSINISGHTTLSDVASSLMSSGAVWDQSFLTRADVMDGGYIIAPFIANAGVTSLINQVRDTIIETSDDAGPVITVLGTVDSYHGDENTPEPNEGHESPDSTMGHGGNWWG